MDKFFDLSTALGQWHRNRRTELVFLRASLKPAKDSQLDWVLSLKTSTGRSSRSAQQTSTSRLVSVELDLVGHCQNTGPRCQRTIALPSRSLRRWSPWAALGKASRVKFEAHFSATVLAVDRPEDNKVQPLDLSNRHRRLHSKAIGLWILLFLLCKNRFVMHPVQLPRAPWASTTSTLTPNRTTWRLSVTWRCQRRAPSVVAFHIQEVWCNLQVSIL